MTVKGSPARFVVVAMVAALIGGLVAGCGGGGGPSGSVEGRVVDKETGLGITDVRVTIGGKSAGTDVNGLYRVRGIRLGLQPVFVIAPAGFAVPDPDPSDPQIGNVNVVRGVNALADIVVVTLPEQPPTSP